MSACLGWVGGVCVEPAVSVVWVGSLVSVSLVSLVCLVSVLSVLAVVSVVSVLCPCVVFILS